MQQLFQLFEKIRQARRLWQVVGYLLTVVALLYAVGILVSGWQQICYVIEWSNLVPAIPMVLAMHLASYLFQLLVWMRLISFRYLTDWHDVEVYSRLMLLRLLPGGILHWLVRAGIYHVSTGIPGQTVVFANFVEWSILLLVGSGVYVLSGFGQSAWIQISLGILLIMLALNIALNWQPKSRPLKLRLIESGVWIVLYAAAWFLGGWIVLVVVYAFGNYTLGIDAALRTWTMTGVIGMLSGMMPISLGIREVTLAWLLRPYVPETVGLLTAFLLRLLFTLADATWSLLVWLLSRRVLSIRRSEVLLTGIPSQDVRE